MMRPAIFIFSLGQLQSCNMALGYFAVFFFFFFFNGQMTPPWQARGEKQLLELGIKEIV